MGVTDFKKKIQQLERALDITQSLPPTPQNLTRQKQLCSEINDLLEKEDLWWKQRSRVDWLKFGDQNTKFFHKKASQRSRKNTIQGLKDANGDWKFSKEDFHFVMNMYFSDLFKDEDLIGINECCSLLNCKVLPNMFEDLLRPFTGEEVLTTLLSMSPPKTSGPDGFNAIFYQYYWDVVGDELSAMVLEILNDHRHPTDLNYTYITLIPKVPKVILPSHFQLISLCNVTMKLVTKCIANRLKHVLPSLIDDSQSAFVPRRLITDNALVAFEAFHYLKCKTKGIKGYMALKLDMAKAYDRME